MIRNLLLTGGPTHDFDAIAVALDGALTDAGITTIRVTHPEALLAALRSEDPADRFDLITVHALHWDMAADRYAHLREEHAYVMTDADAEALESFVLDGGGLLAMHGAVICFDARPAWHRLIGATWVWGRSGHPPLGPVSVRVTDEGRSHPITAGGPDFALIDEIYGSLEQVPGLRPLLMAPADGEDHPLLWARAVGRGRVVTDLLGHDGDSITEPHHREILARSARWAAGRTVDDD